MKGKLTRRKFLGGTAAAAAGSAAFSGTASALTANSSVYTTVNLNVRNGPGTDYGVKATADQYTGAIHVDGPVNSGGHTWWKATFNQDSDNGAVTGWAAEGDGWLTHADFSYPASGTVTSTFYESRSSGYHSAVDIANDRGTNIHSGRSGTAYTYYDAGGYGNYVMIDHGGGWETLYGHLDDFSTYDGESVYWDEVVGYMGSTGNSTGPHVHYEVRYNGDRQYVTPSEEYEGSWYVARTGVQKNYF
jgi:murein DD-endopeptidase MepM/ murein hydrolase activator NlpD